MEHNSTVNRYLSDNERYADLINGYEFAGEQVISPEDLSEADTQVFAPFLFANLQDTSVFRTDLKQVFDFIRYSEDKEKLKELMQNDTAYENLDEDAYDMAALYTKTTELIEIKKFHQKGDKVDMCKAIKEMLQDERQEGMNNGLDKGIEAFILDNIEEKIPKERICEKLQRRFGLTAEEAREKYKKYADLSSN